MPSQFHETLIQSAMYPLHVELDCYSQIERHPQEAQDRNPDFFHFQVSMQQIIENRGEDSVQARECRQKLRQVIEQVKCTTVKAYGEF